MKLTRDFYDRHTAIVAKELIGKQIIYNGHVGFITETECYRGKDDPASHAFKGLSLRSQTMQGPPGHLYIYLIYGMYHCMNIVTESDGDAGAVLIRGIKFDKYYANGPGKICKYLNITLQQNGLDIINSDYLSINHNPKFQSPILATPRIGISKAKEKLWRFTCDINFESALSSKL